MDNLPQDEFEGFERVWRRVMGAKPDGEEPLPWEGGGAVVAEQAPPDPAKTLRALMDAERASYLFYTALLRRCAQQGRVALTRLAADEARHLKELQLEHFLLLGEAYTPAEGYQKQPGILNALRTAYLSEKKSVAEYLAAAEQEAERAPLYRALAAEEMGHAEVLRKLIEKTLR